MLVELVRSPHSGAQEMPPFRASRIPAAIPIVVYPIRTGSELKNAAFHNLPVIACPS